MNVEKSSVYMLTARSYFVKMTCHYAKCTFILSYLVTTTQYHLYMRYVSCSVFVYSQVIYNQGT